VRVHDGGGAQLDVGNDLVLDGFLIGIFGFAGDDTPANLLYRVVDCPDDDSPGESSAGSGALEGFQYRVNGRYPPQQLLVCLFHDCP